MGRVCSNLASSGEPPPPLHKTTLTTAFDDSRYGRTIRIALLSIHKKDCKTHILFPGSNKSTV